MRRKFLPALMLLVMLILAACASSSADGIQVTDAWARPSPAGEMAAMGGVNGGAFMTIRNGSNEADILLGAESPAARVVEIHQTVMNGDVMSMQPVQSLEIPARGEVTLKPGSYHVMLIDLQQALSVGDTIEVTLIFQNAGRVTFQAEIRE